MEKKIYVVVAVLLVCLFVLQVVDRVNSGHKKVVHTYATDACGVVHDLSDEEDGLSDGVIPTPTDITVGGDSSSSTGCDSEQVVHSYATDACGVVHDLSDKEDGLSDGVIPTPTDVTVGGDGSQK